MKNYCCKTMQYECEKASENDDSQTGFWDKYFSIRYRDKKGNWTGVYQGQYCMWCGRKLD